MILTTNLCRADWNACMNPVRTNVGIKISIFFVRITEQNLEDVVFQVSGKNILPHYLFSNFC